MNTINTVKSASLQLSILSGLSMFGLVVLVTFYEIFSFGTIPVAIVNTIDYVFNILFSSLNILAFFIRPATVKIVCIGFCSYWLVRLAMKMIIITVKLGRGFFSYISSFSGIVTTFLCKIFGV